VLKLLHEGPLPVRAQLEHIDIEPAGLSQQLAVLRLAGLVTARRERGTVVYALATSDILDLLQAARRIMAETLADRSELLPDLRPELGPEPGTEMRPGLGPEGQR
jgi:ArsR family transcriptional regulator